VFSLAARNQQVTATQAALLTANGYPDGSGTLQPVFFGDRGSQEFAGYGAFDISINYNVPVFRTLKPWIKLDVYNLFDNNKLIAWNTTITQNKAAGVDSLGLATNYTQGASFGRATGNTVTNLNESTINAFPVAFGGAPAGGRTFLASVGFRF